MLRVSTNVQCGFIIKRIGDAMLNDRDAACLINAIMTYLETQGAQLQGLPQRRIVNSVGELRLVIDLIQAARGGLRLNGAECLRDIVARYGIGELNINDTGFARFRATVERVLKALAMVKVRGEPIIEFTPCDTSCKIPGVVTLRKAGLGFRCPVIQAGASDSGASEDRIDVSSIVEKLENKCGPTYIGFEWAVKQTLKYLEEKGSAKIATMAVDLRNDYMWIVKYLYWMYSEASIPRLVRCVVEELAEAGLVRINGDVVALAK